MVSVLLLILKIIGIAFLVLLSLLLLALTLPVGLRVICQDGTLRLLARCGPLEFVLWPRPSPVKKAEEETSARKQAAETKPVPERNDRVSVKQHAGATVSAAVDTDKTVSDAGSSPPSKHPRKNAASSPPASAGTASGKPEQDAFPLPGFLQRKADALIRRAKSDPISFAKRLICHFGWLSRKLLRSIRVSQLQVFWTVTAEDAAATAIRYGETITVLNELLTLARSYIKIRADSLRVEPDFTGERRRARRISCLIQTRPVTLLLLGAHLLFRIWNDKLLYEESASL